MTHDDACVTTRKRDQPFSYDTGKVETVTLVDVPDVEMSRALAASLLRAIAEEINPPQSKMAGATITYPHMTNSGLR